MFLKRCFLILTLLVVQVQAQVRPANTINSVIRLSNQVASLAARNADLLTKAELDKLAKTLQDARNILNGGLNPYDYCAEISPDYQSTVLKIKTYAYSGEGLNRTSSDSITFALNWVQTHSCDSADEYIMNSKRLKKFAYNGTGLNMSSSDAASYALKNVAVFCADYNLETEFKKLFDFAYSGSGLNMTASDARNYAQVRVEPNAFRCGL